MSQPFQEEANTCKISCCEGVCKMACCAKPNPISGGIQFSGCGTTDSQVNQFSLPSIRFFQSIFDFHILFQETDIQRSAPAAFASQDIEFKIDHPPKYSHFS